MRGCFVRLISVIQMKNITIHTIGFKKLNLNLNHLNDHINDQKVRIE